MRKPLITRPIYGCLGQLIGEDHPDFVQRLSATELKTCIRAGFRTAECFKALSEFNRRLRICRSVSELNKSQDELNS